MSEREEKLKGFLGWYKDLYGDQWFVEQPSSVGDLFRPQAPKLSQAPTSELEQFHQKIKDCQLCPLGETRTKFVFGSGNPQAEIMFIGEAPGRDEDLQGKPFVGKSGQLLTELLNEAGLKREDVYIANILKCRPPNNRDPQSEEIEKCSPYLHRQIELVKPTLLVALGRIAAHKLLATTTSLSKLRGELHRYQDTPLVVTFHPAYILRNMNARPDGLSDMQRIVQYVRNVAAAKARSKQS